MTWMAWSGGAWSKEAGAITVENFDPVRWCGVGDPQALRGEEVSMVSSPCRKLQSGSAGRGGRLLSSGSVSSQAQACR